MERRSFLTLGALASTALALGKTDMISASAEAKKPKKGGIKATPLPTRKLGTLEVSALGLGCQGLGQDMYGVPQPSKADAIKVVQQAFDHGVRFFDTAEAYGPFESERIVGEATQNFRNDIVIATKFGWDIDQQTGKRTGGLNSKPAHIKQVVDNMLRRLRTDRIDLLYQHRADPTVPVEEFAGAVQDLMKQGKVLHWGLCEVSPTTIRKAHKILPLTAIQSEYSLLFRGRENDVLPVCEELGIGFVPWSPLGMGTLCGYVDEHTRFNNPPAQDLKTIIPRFSEQAMKHNLALYQMIDRFAKEKGCTTAQFALAWLQTQKPFIVAIPGTTKGYHLLENLGATDITFTAEELQRYRTALDSFTIEGLRLPEMILNFSEVK